MQKILGKIRKLCEKFNLIEENDKIAVGISGGKDSLVLLSALKKLQTFYDKKFEIVAISIDLSNGNMNFEEIESYCKTIDVPFYKETTNVFEVIFDIRKEKNPCSLCANLRRGHLNSFAQKLGCNKVALGHHCDDLIETFIMSLFFEGRLSTLQPISYLSRTDLYVIRPMLFVEEKDIESLATNLPVVKNQCPADHHTQREEAKNILKIFESKYPLSKEKLLNAITNFERYNLWKFD
jgi:tRNA(Ile)-lysidine synthase TilS/MesJ